MADAVHIAGDHKHIMANTSQSHGGFTPGMARANYDTGIVRHSSRKNFFVGK
jgi:hypothetical protein